MNSILVVLLISILGSVVHCILNSSQGNPTVYPAAGFNAVKDAAILRKAMQGFGTDEEAIIEIIGKRSQLQRSQIAEAYKTSYGRDLLDDLKSELSGNFKATIVALMKAPLEFRVTELYDAMAGLGTDDEALIEILTMLSNNEIKSVIQLYEKKYGHSLESDLIGDTSGDFQRYCVSRAQGNRNENQMIDIPAARIDAAALYEAGAGQPGTDASVFNSILATRSWEQLQQIFDEYSRIAGHSLEKAVTDEFSGSIREAFLATIQWCRSKNEFFADRLYNAMAGYFTNDDTLIRIIVDRSEIDLGDIDKFYERKYGKSLESSIEDELSGDYRNILLTIASN